MGWEYFGVIRFDLGLLLQGQMRIDTNTLPAERQTGQNKVYLPDIIDSVSIVFRLHIF